MEVIGGGGELESGGVVAVDRDHWCGRVQRCRVRLLWTGETGKKRDILGKTSGFDSAKGTTYNTIPCLQTSPQS